jgi:hypothetical protein
MDGAEFGVRLITVTKRIDVRIAARQKDSIESGDRVANKLLVWDQWDVDRQSTGSLDGFTVMSRKIEAVGFEFDAHRDSDAWTRGFCHLIQSIVAMLCWRQHNSADG